MIDKVLNAAFGIVAVVAGIVGVVMLVAPGSTDDYFSWALGPPAEAALVGGLYVASTVVFGYAIGKTWSQVRGLVAAVLGLTVPTLIATFVHSEVFDFGRVVAIIWVVLFVASPSVYGTILVLRRDAPIDAGVPIPLYLRAIYAILAFELLVIAVLSWVDRDSAEAFVPFALTPMGAKFLGAWSLFLAVLALWVVLRGSSVEARIPLLGLIAYPAGAVLAALTTWGDLGAGRWLWLGELVALALLSAFAFVRFTRA